MNDFRAFWVFVALVVVAAMMFLYTRFTGAAPGETPPPSQRFQTPTVSTGPVVPGGSQR